MVLVAYLGKAPDGSWIVWDWDWTREDLVTPGHPDGWQDDYEERTWTRS
jgi:hypothetical protein